MRYSHILLVSLLFFACGNAQKSPDKEKDTVKTARADPSVPAKTILFFGNSLTAGYGLDNPQDDAFPSVIQQKIDSLKLPYKAVNAGLSGETSAGGLGRIDWLLKQKVDVFVLELGANDGLRGIPVASTKKNLQAILDKVKAKYPQAKILVTGMMVPPNMGEAYAKDFRTVFPDLAKKNDAVLMPFLLVNVAGEAKLNQKDGIHPTKEGAKIVADNVWEKLKGML